jgi:hypothetical protein
MNWLNIEPTIQILEISSSDITTIDTGAFNATPFTNTNTLMLKNLSIQYLQNGLFSGFKALLNLILEDLPLQRIDPTVLSPFMSTLKTLQFEGMIYPINPKNLTGSNKLNVLQTVSLQNNNFEDFIDSDTFSGLTKVISLYLGNNKIASVGKDTFNILQNSVMQIHLQDNELTSLPLGVFDRFIGRKEFQVHLEGNPWECDCNLDDLKQFMVLHNQWFVGRPTCSSPDEFMTQLLIEADFCPIIDQTIDTTSFGETESTCENSDEKDCQTDVTETWPVTTLEPCCNQTTTMTTTTKLTTTTQTTTTKITTTTEESTTTKITTTTEESTTTKITTTTEESTTTKITTTTEVSTTTTTTEESTTQSSSSTISPTTDTPFENVVISLFCDRSSQQELKIFQPDPTFYIYDIEPGIVEIVLETATPNLAIVWFYVNSNVSQISNWNNDINMGCMINVQQSFRIQNLLPTTIYSFCLMPKDWNAVSPFSCIPHITLPNLNDKIWLEKDDQSLFISIAIFLIILSILLGASVTFLMIRRKPSLLRGSKRVVVVGNRSTDIMVMPADYEMRNQDSSRTLPNVYNMSNMATMQHSFMYYQNGSKKLSMAPIECPNYIPPMADRMQNPQ